MAISEEEIKAKNRERAASWRKENPDKVKAAAKKYKQSASGKDKGREYRKALQATPEYKAQAAEKMRLWRANNPDKVKANNARYLDNPDRKKRASERAAEWKRENAERAERWSREYYDKNRDAQIASAVQWQKDNPEKVAIRASNYRARKKADGGKLSKDLVAKLMTLQKSKCACCKVNLDGKNRHLDHIISLASGGPNVDSNMQLLCASCNCSKRAKDPVEFMQSRGYLL